MADMQLAPIIDWIDEVNGEKATTFARFRIELNGSPLWPIWGDRDSDLDIFVDDVLAYLTDFWRVLLLRQSFPFAIRADRPSEFAAAVERLVRSGRKAGREEEMLGAAGNFAEAHNLATCFSGQFQLPAFWMFRQADRMLIETAGRVERVPLESWVAFAEELGDVIAERLSVSGEGRWDLLLEDWSHRDSGDPVSLAKLRTGQTTEIAEELLRDGLILSSTSVSDAANDNDAISIAARMIGPVPYPQISRVLSVAKRIGPGSPAKLDELESRLRDRLAVLEPTTIPHVQGARAANAVRMLLPIAPDAKVDPIEVLTALEVDLQFAGLGIPNLDALAIWGPGHGPAVLVNTDSKRRPVQGQRQTPALRSIAGHELCHFLLDRGRALGAVDILGGLMPLQIEQRANAFAAEFMLPGETAARLWRGYVKRVTPDELSMFLSRLVKQFGVSRLVASWQLDHGLNGSDPDVVFWLDQLVPARVG